MTKHLCREDQNLSGLRLFRTRKGVSLFGLVLNDRSTGVSNVAACDGCPSFVAEIQLLNAESMRQLEKACSTQPALQKNSPQQLSDSKAYLLV